MDRAARREKRPLAKSEQRKNRGRVPRPAIRFANKVRAAGKRREGERPRGCGKLAAPERRALVAEGDRYSADGGTESCFDDTDDEDDLGGFESGSSDSDSGGSYGRAPGSNRGGFDSGSGDSDTDGSDNSDLGSTGPGSSSSDTVDSNTDDSDTDDSATDGSDGNGLGSTDLDSSDSDTEGSDEIGLDTDGSDENGLDSSTDSDSSDLASTGSDSSDLASTGSDSSDLASTGSDSSDLFSTGSDSSSSGVSSAKLAASTAGYRKSESRATDAISTGVLAPHKTKKASPTAARTSGGAEDRVSPARPTRKPLVRRTNPAQTRKKQNRVPERAREAESRALREFAAVHESLPGCNETCAPGASICAADETARPPGLPRKSRAQQNRAAGPDNGDGVCNLGRTRFAGGAFRRSQQKLLEKVKHPRWEPHDPWEYTFAVLQEFVGVNRRLPSREEKYLPLSEGAKRDLLAGDERGSPRGVRRHAPHDPDGRTVEGEQTDADCPRGKRAKRQGAQAPAVSGESRCRAPFERKSFELGRWCRRQRHLRRTKKLRPDREKKLNGLPGWEWELRPPRLPWEEMLGLLAEFVRTENRMPRIKDRCRAPDGRLVNIAPWCHRQRRLFKARSLSEDKAKQLALKVPGWWWSRPEMKMLGDEEWEKRLSVLKEFVAAAGRLPKPGEQYVADDGETYSLGRWCDIQQVFYKNESLSEERKGRLENEVQGWQWTAPTPSVVYSEERWQFNYALLQLYTGANGRLPKVSDDPISVSATRSSAASAGISVAAFDRMRGELESDSVRLGLWCGNQRQIYARKKMCGERAKLLGGIPGWEWYLGGAHHPTWDEAYVLLRQYAEEHGRVPTTRTVYHGCHLGEWCAAQKRRRETKQLSPERTRLLESIGAWEWGGTTASIISYNNAKWDEKVALVREYMDLYGRFPPYGSKFRGVGLGQWCSTQRRRMRKGLLDPERALRLDGLAGWWWDKPAKRPARPCTPSA